MLRGGGHMQGAVRTSGCEGEPKRVAQSRRLRQSSYGSIIDTDLRGGERVLQLGRVEMDLGWCRDRERDLAVAIE